jgi:hypothetical protein
MQVLSVTAMNSHQVASPLQELCFLFLTKKIKKINFLAYFILSSFHWGSLIGAATNDANVPSVSYQLLSSASLVRHLQNIKKGIFNLD